MVYDFKKEFKSLYKPSSTPSLIDVPKMNFIAIYGKGDPNSEGGTYQQAIQALYALAYALRMSHKTDYHIDGYFEYVVPPLEGFWWQEGIKGVDYKNKANFNWISMIRLPDFIGKKDLKWAKSEVLRKKKIDATCADFLTLKEGLCVQIMHIGPYNDEPKSIAKMNSFIADNGYVTDISEIRRHHEIYLSNFLKTTPEKLKTIIRHPIRKRG